MLRYRRCEDLVCAAESGPGGLSPPRPAVSRYLSLSAALLTPPIGVSASDWHLHLGSGIRPTGDGRRHNPTPEPLPSRASSLDVYPVHSARRVLNTISWPRTACLKHTMQPPYAPLAPCLQTSPVLRVKWLPRHHPPSESSQRLDVAHHPSSYHAVESLPPVLAYATSSISSRMRWVVASGRGRVHAGGEANSHVNNPGLWTRDGVEWDCVMTRDIRMRWCEDERKLKRPGELGSEMGSI